MTTTDAGSTGSTGSTGSAARTPVEAPVEALVELPHRARGPLGRTIRRLLVHLANLTSDLLGDDVVGRRLRVAVLRALGARIGAGSSLHGGTWVGEPDRLRIGRDCFVNRRCYLDLEGTITLEDGVTLGHGTTVVTAHHATGPTQRRCGPFEGRPVHVGRGAWLGANVTVLPGVRIGRGAVVGAGSVVTGDVPDDVVVTGVPARVVEGARLPGPDHATFPRQGHRG